MLFDILSILSTRCLFDCFLRAFACQTPGTYSACLSIPLIIQREWVTADLYRVLLGIRQNQAHTHKFVIIYMYGYPVSFGVAINLEDRHRQPSLRLPRLANTYLARRVLASTLVHVSLIFVPQTCCGGFKGAEAAPGGWKPPFHRCQLTRTHCDWTS